MATTYVTDFASLKSALTDTTSTDIILQNNITFTSSGGIEVNLTKGDITLDGAGFTITDYTSTGSGDCIKISGSSAPTITITYQNINWVGNNYYGMLYVNDASGNSGITWVIDNVTYSGPQPIYNRAGSTVIDDSSFIIQQNAGSSNAQEFAEANNITFEGTVSITRSASNSNAIVWMANANPYITVTDGSTLVINAGGSASVFYNALSSSGNATFNFSNPKSVVLYNNNSPLFTNLSTGTTTFNINAELVNYWSTAKTPFASAGGFNDTPTSAFSVSGGDVSAVATLQGLTTTITSSNCGMTSTNFNLYNCKVLAMGELDLSVDKIMDSSTDITGTTNAYDVINNANISATYGSTTLTGTADTSGDFSVAIPASIPATTSVTVSANWNFLTTTTTAIVGGILEANMLFYPIRF